MEISLENTIRGLPSSLYTVSPNASDDNGFYIFYKHSIDLNRKLNVEDNIVLYSIIKISIIKKENNEVHKLKVTINLSRYDEHQKAYVVSFPNSTKMYYFPQKIYDDKSFVWNSREESIIFKDKKYSLETFLKKLLEKHLMPVKIYKGILIRVSRVFRWGIAKNIVLSIIHLDRLLIFLFSGKKVKIVNSIDDNKESMVKTYVKKTETKIEKAEKIEFFGLKAKPIPLSS